MLLKSKPRLAGALKKSRGGVGVAAGGMTVDGLRLLDRSLGGITILLLFGVGFGLGFGLPADTEMRQPWARIAQVGFSPKPQSCVYFLYVVLIKAPLPSS